MLESNLVGGTQKLVKGKPLTYGQSITDACIGWDETHKLLQELAGSVHKGRAV
jgi:3-deoxy-7-phosphoheptulonate synthase